MYPHRNKAMNKLAFLVFITAIAAALTACQTPAGLPKGRPQLVAEPDKATLMLAEAADKASTALSTLAAVEAQRTPPKPSVDPATIPPELQRAITVNWIGPVEPLARLLADRAGYKFEIFGTAPITPAVVSVDVENTPIFNVLRSVGLQLGDRTDLHLNSSTSTLELKYGTVNQDYYDYEDSYEYE